MEQFLFTPCGHQVEYCPPEISVLEVTVEQGFAASGEGNEQLPGWKPTYW